MTTDNLHAAARALTDARASRTPIAAPAAHFGLTGLDDAYRVQSLGIDLALAGGERLAGAKAGLISPAMQVALKVGEPVYGRLLAGLRCQSGACIARERLLQPRIEAELALLIGRDLPPGELDLATFRACIAGAVAAIEINDTAVANWQIGLLDSVADNLCAGSLPDRRSAGGAGKTGRCRSRCATATQWRTGLPADPDEPRGDARHRPLAGAAHGAPGRAAEVRRRPAVRGPGADVASCTRGCSRAGDRGARARRLQLRTMSR